ncbi:MAG TPA: hypothetical protein DC009_04030 [Porphyromonadaceae bacterium]|nr:hypothetical protein [Porphyromonadaceae bacterium]
MTHKQPWEGLPQPAFPPLFISPFMYTLEQLKSRHSVRSYTDEPLSGSEANALRAAISEINSYLPGTRFQLVTGDDTPFRGRFGSYGIFRNVRNYIAAVMDTAVVNALETAGYAGQKVVMAATVHGLGTCFIGGTFSVQNLPIQTRAGEKPVFIIAVGHSSDANGKRLGDKLIRSFSHRRKMTAVDFFDTAKSGMSFEEATKVCPQLAAGLEAIACAPSAMNKRPVRIRVDADGTYHAFVPNMSGFTPVDLGIAKFNFEQVVPGEWERGNDAPFLTF